MTPRTLRLLVVDDHPKNVAQSFENLEQVNVPTFYDGEKPRNCVARMTQVLKLIATDSIPSFDLLCIDVNFNNDPTDLDYYNEVVGGRIDKDAKNPMGLFWGMVLAMHRKSQKSPFGFAVYSGGANELAEDAVANAAFGVYLALQGMDFTKDNANEIDVKRQISDCIRNMGCETITDARDRLIENFRENIKTTSIPSGGIDRANVAELIEACRKEVALSGDPEETLEALKGLGFRLIVDGEGDEIRLDSLFLDCPDFCRRDVTTTVIPQLESYLETYDNTAIKLNEYVVEALAQVGYVPIGESESEVRIITAVNLATKGGKYNPVPPREDIVFGMILCSILDIMKSERYAHFFEGDELISPSKRNAYTSFKNELKRRIGGVDQDGPINRELAKVYGLSCRTFAAAVDMILRQGQQEVPSRFKVCGAKYAQAIDLKELPAFVQPQGPAGGAAEP